MCVAENLKIGERCHIELAMVQSQRFLSAEVSTKSRMFRECNNLARMDIQTCPERYCGLIEVYICFIWGNQEGFCKSQEFAFSPVRNSDKTTALPMPEGRHLAQGLEKVYTKIFRAEML